MKQATIALFGLWRQSE